MLTHIDTAASQLLGVVITIALTLLMGLEREEKSAAERTYLIGGVRSFPLIGLVGHIIAFLSPDSALPIAVGLVAVSGFLIVSYMHKLREAEHGATTEFAVLVAYLVGALVGRGLLWIATPVAVGSMLLLQAKVPLERFALGLPRYEVATFVKFLLLAGVILPILPNEEFTQFALNPFKTWLIVVAVSGLSYASYIVQRLLRSRRSILLTAVLGGTYSSTLVTVVLSKQARQAGDVRLFAGATLLASAVMYVRIAILLWIFNAALGWQLGPRFLALALAAACVALVIALLGRAGAEQSSEFAGPETKNPLELHAAFIFAGLFLAISVGTQLASRYAGSAGLYVLAAVMGVTDVDAFVMSLTQTAGQATPLSVAAIAIVLTAASNNIAKGAYALGFGGRRAGVLSCGLLWGLALCSLMVLIGL